MRGEQDRDALVQAIQDGTEDAYLADLIAQAEQRGREDNERHDTCLVHGSKALAEHERRVRASALREFARWVAVARAYDGSPHHLGQALYNECLNAVLRAWADEWLAEQADQEGER